MFGGQVEEARGLAAERADVINDLTARLAQANEEASCVTFMCHNNNNNNPS